MTIVNFKKARKTKEANIKKMLLAWKIETKKKYQTKRLMVRTIFVTKNNSIMLQIVPIKTYGTKQKVKKRSQKERFEHS